MAYRRLCGPRASGYDSWGTVSVRGAPSSGFSASKIRTAARLATHKGQLGSPGMIAIIDYGMGNLRSVQKALEAVGASAEVTCDPDRVRRADKVILPGVGAFRDAIDELRRTGLGEAFRDVVTAGQP